MAKIYYDQDADLSFLKDKTIAIIGYGIQGRGQALCLRDSGLRVVISEMEGTPNFEQAKKDGFVPVAAVEAAGAGDII
ncbi:MAG: ketol-acid reductoisomerase, partial [Candidatus Omnitrophica bacterium]|nr:ketol-acid reductoisomerase [Candidatus Omnitrophota bacterium]